MATLVIETGRADVSLRQLTENDFEPLLELIKQNHERIGWMPEPREAWSALRTTPCYRAFGISLKEVLVGYLYLFDLQADYYGEIGYWIDGAHEGQGIMSASLRALVSHAFETGNYWRLSAIVRGSNPRSRNLLERLGFSLTSNPEGSHSYALQANEWST